MITAVGSGIASDNTKTTISRIAMENVGAGYRGALNNTYPYNGNGISYINNQANEIATSNNDDPHANNAFIDLNCGIYINNAKFKLKDNKISNNKFGILVANSPTSDNFISNNDITSDFFGINVENNGGLDCEIRDNSNITCLATTVDGSAMRIAGNSGTVNIQDNFVTNEAGESGILIDGCSNVTINKNTVNTNSSNSTRTDAIYLVSSTACNVKCNKISCTSFEHSTSAIEIQESPANMVSCNEMQGAYCGLVFAGSCNPNAVGENTLADHDLGLVLVTRVTGSDGIIGPQPHMGNHLTGCSNDQDAVYYGAPDIAAQSIFTVSNISPYLPNNIQDLENLGWFETGQGQEYSCITNNICPDGIGARSSVREPYMLNMDLLYQSIGLNRFDDSRTWSARKNILQYIKSQKIQTKEAKQWLKIFANTSLDLYSDIGVFCNNYLPESDHLKTLLLEKNNQTNSSNGQVAKIGNSLQELINSEIKKLNIQKNIKINVLLAALMEEKPLTIFEQNQKVVSQIRLHQLQNPIGFTNNEMDILTNIAYKCPYEEGNGVYEARMLLRSTKPVVAKEEDLCGSRENYHLDGKVQIKNMLVYPNPSNENIHITLKGTKGNEIYSGKLMELSGRVVKEFSISNFYDLSTFTFEPGMYILSINNNPQWTTKVFIQK